MRSSTAPCKRPAEAWSPVKGAFRVHLDTRMHFANMRHVQRQIAHPIREEKCSQHPRSCKERAQMSEGIGGDTTNRAFAHAMKAVEHLTTLVIRSELVDFVDTATETRYYDARISSHISFASSKNFVAPSMNSPRLSVARCTSCRICLIPSPMPLIFSRMFETFFACAKKM